MKKIMIMVVVIYNVFCLSVYASEKQESLFDIKEDCIESLKKINSDIPVEGYKLRLKFDNLEDTEDEYINATSTTTYYNDGRLDEAEIIVDKKFEGSSYEELRYLVQHELIHVLSFGSAEDYEKNLSEGLTDLVNVYILKLEGIDDPSCDSSSELFESTKFEKQEIKTFINENNINEEECISKYLKYFENKKYFSKYFEEFK